MWQNRWVCRSKAGKSSGPTAELNFGPAAKHMNRTAFITGAEGFIGFHLVTFLQAQRWNVIGGYLSHDSSSFATAPGSRFVPCDLRNRQCVSELIQKFQPTHVFHLGAHSSPTLSWADPFETFESNIMGSLNLLEATRHLKRPPIVVSACSSAEYGHVPASATPVTEEQPLWPLHPYGISKVCLDLLAREYFLDYRVPTIRLRLFNTTGPRKTDDAPSDFVRQLIRIKKGLQPPIIEVGNLKTRRAYLDVHDAVRGFYLVALRGKPGEAYNLCANRIYQIREVLGTAIRLSGMEAEIRPVPRLMRRSDEKIIFGSSRKIREDTGWRPLNSIEHTLKSMLHYWEAVT